MKKISMNIPWNPCFMVKSCFFSTISLGVPNPPRLPCRRAPHRPSCLVLHLPLDREMSEKPTGDVIMAISLDMEKNMQIFNWDVFWMYINIMAYHIISWDYFWDVFIVVLWCWRALRRFVSATYDLGSSQVMLARMNEPVKIPPSTGEFRGSYKLVCSG